MSFVFPIREISNFVTQNVYLFIYYNKYPSNIL